ncbi:MAG: hypothetical protein M1827_000690 [Pycnora praestabilis]|nr:MAG: hypothetical protein M1827_000690 [Pycnora praestabilis]
MTKLYIVITFLRLVFALCDGFTYATISGLGYTCSVSYDIKSQAKVEWTTANMRLLCKLLEHCPVLKKIIIELNCAEDTGSTSALLLKRCGGELDQAKKEIEGDDDRERDDEWEGKKEVTTRKRRNQNKRVERMMTGAVTITTPKGMRAPSLGSMVWISKPYEISQVKFFNGKWICIYEIPPSPAYFKILFQEE